MTKLTSASCTDSPAIDQNPPAAPFDTFTGTGIGKLNNIRERASSSSSWTPANRAFSTRPS